MLPAGAGHRLLSKGMEGKMREKSLSRFSEPETERLARPNLT